MIIDLAIYEKEPDAVKATPEMLRDTIFKHKYAEVFIARTEGGEAVGFALVSPAQLCLTITLHDIRWTYMV